MRNRISLWLAWGLFGVLAGTGLPMLIAGKAIGAILIAAGVLVPLWKHWGFWRPQPSGAIPAVSGSTGILIEGNVQADVEGNLVAGFDQGIVGRQGARVAARKNIVIGGDTSAPPPPGESPLGGAELIRLFQRGATDLQGRALVKPYLGQWVQASGEISSVMLPLGGRIAVSTVAAAGFWWLLLFDEARWENHLHGTMPGDGIRVRGRLHSVAKDSVSLEDCELLGA